MELMICALLTILPDYLYRRFRQGKRWGKEITFFSMWFELRWGIVSCLILTVSLISVIFYYHPAASNVTLAFRTVSLLPQQGGRVAEVMVQNNETVDAGTPIFRLDDQLERAEVAEAQQRLAEAQAQQSVAAADLAAARGALREAEGALEQAVDELESKTELSERNSDTVAERELERLQVRVDEREGGVDAARAQRDAVQAQIDDLIPAQIAAAEASLEEAQVRLDRTVVRAGVSGTLEQFGLQVGDFVSSVRRPAGILVPTAFQHRRAVAAFDQITAQVVKPGMIAEMTCSTLPFTVIPMVIVEVQNVIADGAIRPTDNLVDVQTRRAPGTITTFMEPLYSGGLDKVPPGSRCSANAYTSFHDELEEGGLGPGETVFYHVVDTVGLIHAAILRIHALLFPVTDLVLSGH